MIRLPDTEQALADRFVEAQGLDPDQALTIATKISNADEDILAAAMTWVESGAFMESPLIEGATPAKLANDYSPSQVFTILIMLRRDPQHAKQMLRWFPKDGGSNQQH